MKRLLFMLIIPLVLLSGCEKPNSISYSQSVGNFTFIDNRFLIENGTNYYFARENGVTYNLYGDNLTIKYSGDNVTIIRIKK